jgi:hypothetical protein
MRYLLMIYLEPTNLAPESEVARAMNEEYRAYTGWLQEGGMLLGGEALQGVANATSVAVRDGRRIVTDGPFAETKEHLAGYYLVEAPDLDAAIDAAARIPGARLGTIEVRPIQELV